MSRLTGRPNDGADPADRAGEALEERVDSGVSARRRLLLLMLLLLVSCAAVGATSLWLLYDAAFEQEALRLREMASSRALQIEAVADHLMKSAGATETTLSDVVDAVLEIQRASLDHAVGFTSTAVRNVGRRVGDDILMLSNDSETGRETTGTIPFRSELGTPMRRALEGQSGTMVGVDSLGQMVLAAYEPVRGSTFSFRFAAGAAGALPNTPGEACRKIRSIKAGQGERRVLVVDDDETGRELTEILLRRVGYEVRKAENGSVAMEVAREWKPHLVLTDKLMPVMDGVDMAHRLRAEFGRGSIPVIMVSGSASQGEARELLEGAVESFLPKPLNLDLLYAEAARLCKVEYDYCEAEPPADQRGRGQA